mgnify:CR=1 FL=1
MSPITIALIILAITVVLFIWEPIPIIVTAIGASIAFAYTGLITIEQKVRSCHDGYQTG